MSTQQSLIIIENNLIKLIAMNLKYSTTTIFLVCIFLSHVYASTSESTCMCVPATDEAALIDLYNSTGGAGWSNPWDLNLTPDMWAGVTLDANLCVISLDLSSNGLLGTIPSSLGDLSNLTYLNLGSNQINGNIPPELGNLSNLTYLGLYDNQLSGGIPSELGNLTSLTQDLNLRTNNLSGSIPPELGNLTNLVWMRLFENQLTGSIPAEIGDMTNMQFLDLSKNQLSGNIPPQLGNLTNLEKLWLNQNQLTGSIPAEFGNLANLEYLYLLLNQLSGCYDVNLLNLCSQLSPAVNTNLYISDFNNFDAPWEDFCATGAGSCAVTSCTCDPAADEAALLDLYNSAGGANWSNPWDISQSPNNWMGVLLNANNCVKQLLLVNRGLSGTIPASLGNLADLEVLNLAANSLTGVIPPSIGDLCNLEKLTLNNNQLSGIIPSSLGNLSNLNFIELSANSLNGSIPVSIGDLSLLQTFSARDNALTGTLPESLGNLVNLEYLYLFQNMIGGSIPSSFGSLSSIINLRLDNNQLTGPIPPDLGMLNSAGLLFLNNNLLTGEMPKEFANMSSLNTLNISTNDLSGCYHPDLSILCTQLTLSSNGRISSGNSFDENWEDFCMNGVGTCIGNTTTSMDVWVYDYNADTYDIIPGVPYDDTVLKFYTDHEVSGNAVEFIDNTVPDEFNTPLEDLVYKVDFQPGNFGNPILPIEYIKFLLPQLMSDDFDDVRYPYSAIAKINKNTVDGTHQATGTMISPNHVLTARHSVICPAKACGNSTSVAISPLYVIPGFDNILAPGTNISSKVARVYYPESSAIDIAILELEEPVGECSGWMSYGFDTNTSVFANALMQKAGYPSTAAIVNLGFSGVDLTTSKGIFDGPVISVKDHWMGQGGESGGPVFTTNNNDEYLVHGTLLGNNMNHHYFSPQLFYSYFDIIQNTVNNGGSCFDFPNVCPDFVDLTLPETNLENVNAKIELLLNETLDPTTNRVYESENTIIMDPGFSVDPMNSSFVADIDSCPQ